MHYTKSHVQIFKCQNVYFSLQNLSLLLGIFNDYVVAFPEESSLQEVRILEVSYKNF